MAGLGAVNLVGESIAALLRTRRSLLAEENRLAPVPATQDIAHVSLAKLTGTTPPTAGLALACYHIGRSDQPQPQLPARDPAASIGISFELSYLLASYASAPADEQSLLSWAMLELDRYPLLDRGRLLGGDQWGRDEMLQVVPEPADADRLLRLWEALKLKPRLGALYKVRTVRIGYGPNADVLPVAATRFGFADADGLSEVAS